MKKIVLQMRLKKLTIILFSIIKALLCLSPKLNDKHLLLFNSDVNVVNFSVDDIFDDDFIPVRIMTEQLYHILNTNYINKEKLFVQTPEFISSTNSTDLSTAVEAMSYHRNMMNKYLLSSYIFNEIIRCVSNSTTERRLGRAKNNSYTDVDNRDVTFLPNNHKLINDEGSPQYFTWLKRMATYEDIQKNLKNKNRKGNDQKPSISSNHRQSMNIDIEPTYSKTDSGDGLDYLEDGYITGYHYANASTNIFSPNNSYKNHQKSLSGEKLLHLHEHDISKKGYENSYDAYTGPLHSLSNLSLTSPSKQAKEIGLKDITDIAFTTLAFLSFGMFILQVLMCVTMSKDNTNNMVMLPMEGTDNGDIPGDNNTDEIRRKRRSIFPTQLQNIEVIDNLAKRALLSLNAVFSIPKDGGACHHYSLCENNKFSRKLCDTETLWIPIWSLGVSWLTIKFSNTNRTLSVTRTNLIINSLKAIMIGLNSEDCSIFYEDKCKVIFNGN